MPFRPEDFATAGPLQGAVAASLLQAAGQDREPAAGDQIGVYRIERELGRGGMAVVYLASRADGEYAQKVALKWMPGWRADPAGEAMFRRERQSLADLAHPNIARLLDGGRSEDGRPWFAMEYIDGAPLDRHCVRGQLPRDQRLGLFLQVCAAVSYAHARGILHRDIKPGNVLVDLQGQAKLLDFGIARLLGQQAESESLAAFTPGFASPEQQRGEAPTVASDVFQLGRLLACLLASEDAERARLTTAIPGNPSKADAPAHLDPDLPAGDLGAVIRRATAADASQRHPTVEALSEDIRAVLARRPVSARPRTAGYLAWRFLQRHPVAGTATALGAALVLGLGSVFLWRLDVEREHAETQARIANAALEFVRQDLLEAADPAARQGHELSVREALDRAADRVGERFAAQPVEQAAIRLTLARLYSSLGRDQESLYQAELVGELALMDDTAGQGWRAALLAVDALINLDRLDEAAERLQGLAGQAKAAPEWELERRQRQAWILDIRGHYADAEVLLHELVAEAARRRGLSTLTRSLMHDHANALQMLGRQDEALETLRRIYQESREQHGPRHPASLAGAHALAVLQRHRGDFAASAERLEDTVAGRRVVLGSEHPETLRSVNELATAYQELRRFDEAEPLFREALAVRERLYGAEHPLTRNSLSNLGLLYSIWGRLDEASQLYARTLALEARLLGEQHPDTLALMHNIAGLNRRLARYTESLELHDKAIEGARETLGEGAWQTALFRAGKANTLQAMQRWDEADDEFAAAEAILREQFGEQHPRTLRLVEMRKALHEARRSAP